MSLMGKLNVLIYPMTDKELIEEYIDFAFNFTSNGVNFCVGDEINRHLISLNQLRNIMERMFPNMGSREVCTLWFQRNLMIMFGDGYNYLKTYKLVLGNNPSSAWDVINHEGKEFDFNEFQLLFPNHTKDIIKKLYNDWFDEQRDIATSKEMGISKNTW